MLPVWIINGSLSFVIDESHYIRIAKKRAVKHQMLAHNTDETH